MNRSVQQDRGLEADLIEAAVLLERLVAERCKIDDSEWTWQPVSGMFHDVLDHLRWMKIWPGITEEQSEVFERARLSVEGLVSRVDEAEAEARRPLYKSSSAEGGD